MKPKGQQIDVRLLPKQYDFVMSDARETLYSGGVGAGKTRGLCIKLAMRANRPGAVEALCRKHLVSLKTTTLKTLLEPTGTAPAVLPPGSYDHNKSEKTIRIRGGGQIVYFGLDEPDKIGSFNLSGVAIDQAEELAEPDYRALRERIRVQVEGIGNQIYAACNPRAPEHHLAVRFGYHPHHPAAPGCVAITAKLLDNAKHLPPEYVADLLTYTGIARRRHVEGEWCGAEGLVYDTFGDRHQRERQGPWSRVVAGVDWGFRHASAIVVVAKDEANRLHTCDEWYQRGKEPGEVVAAAVALRNDYGVSEFAYDPSAPVIGELLTRAGLSAVKADNDVSGGIITVQKSLAIDGTGTPGHTVSPKCINLIREAGVHEWMPGKDKPKKENDDALDAWRYAVRRHQAGGVAVVCINLPTLSSGARVRSNDEHMWNTVWSQDGGSRR